MRCKTCGHWNRCPRCTGNICEACGAELSQPPNEEEYGLTDYARQRGWLNLEASR